MLEVLSQASVNVFVPLTVGGGIREYTDPISGKTSSALEVAGAYFRYAILSIPQLIMLVYSVYFMEL